MNVIDQLPPSIEWRVYSGDTARLTVFIVDADDKAIDLTGYTFEGQLRVSPNQQDPEASLGIVANDNGLVSITILDTTTLLDQMYFDVQATSPDNVVNTILRGVIIKEQDVTR